MIINTAKFSKMLDNFHWINYNKLSNKEIIKGQQLYITFVTAAVNQLITAIIANKQSVKTITLLAQFILDANYIYEFDYEQCKSKKSDCRLLNPDIILKIATKRLKNYLPKLNLLPGDTIKSSLIDLANPYFSDNKQYCLNTHPELTIADLLDVTEQLSIIEKQLFETIKLADADSALQEKLVNVDYALTFCIILLLQYIK